MAPTRFHRGGVWARGFTLIEAMMASAVLASIVLAVASGLGASQGVAFEGQKRMLASIAANDLMSELATIPYAELATWNGMDQPVGSMSTVDGAAYPATFWSLGRRVEVVPTTMNDSELGAPVSGAMVRVSVMDEFGVVAEVSLFVAEPM